MLISPSEPFPLKAIGKVSALPERYGCDVLVVAKGKRTGVQRKKFPDDLLSSLADGRLYTQLPKMAELDRTILVIEGFGQWTSDGELVDMRTFRKSQLDGLILSIAFEFGVQVHRVRDITETVSFLEHLEVWANKSKHQSLLNRPGPKKDSWGNLGVREFGAHFLQSFPGVGPELAMRIYDHFGRVPVRWDLDGPEDLMAVRGVGKGKARKIWEVLAIERNPGNTELVPKEVL